MEFKGKKLLIMGDNAETTALVEIARDMGVYTVVIGMHHGSPAKAVADVGFDINGLDVAGVVAIARKEKVDGVLVGVAEVLVGAYERVCAELGFPCYPTREVVNTFSQKDRFKHKCEQYGIRGIPSYPLTADMRPEDVRSIRYPVMVKPVDNGGGVGMTLCYDETQLAPAVAKALAASRRRRVIVEKYMTCDDMGLYYTFVGGQYSASMVYDRYTSDEQPGLSRVCLGGTYPSKFIDQYYALMHENACRMFRDLGIKNGVLMLSAFFENDTFYVYDAGFRLQGEAPHLFLKHLYGYDQREMLIRFALTGSMGGLDITSVDSPMLHGKWLSTLWLLLRSGVISRVEGLDEAKADSCVIDVVQRLFVGDQVEHEWVGNEKQVLARLYIVCDTKEALASKLSNLRASIRVFDEKGQDMLLHGFDVNKALRL
ncbi:MAG: carbamoyl-phosphate-synthetase [Bacillota bacterium]|nr:carbamoyl-phosphate-synthetase [Bacillota bacterium]